MLKPVVISTVASLLRLRVTPPVVHLAPPRLGEHTDEVPTELGLQAIDIAELRQRQVI